ncbi:MAG: hypothetical protein ABI683_02435 [Ginsengibacter sp.]
MHNLSLRNFLLIAVLLINLCSCQKKFLRPETADVDSTAVFSLIGAPGNCSNVSPAGIYKKGVSLNTSNTITVDVNVTKTGNWSALTNTVNGILFSGASDFVTTGSQTITLQGAGLPVQAGTSDFIVKAGGASCNFTLSVDTSSQSSIGNIPPVAHAGMDMMITLPMNTITLIGSGTDADGTISSYSWKKIAGPAAFTIVSPGQAQTVVNNLVAGTYEFELTVTDNLGAQGKDTVSVQVDAAITSGTLAIQQDLIGFGPLSDIMHYDSTGKITRITSNNYPERIIYYANNKISSIEYWYNIGNGTLYKGQTDNFVYDANSNVSKINETDEVSNYTYLFALFTYNVDNTMNSKKTYFNSGSPLIDYSFIYNNGNLTGFINNITGDTTFATYDSRSNNFNAIYPQYYFLDLQTVYDQNYRSEIFYFSKNYPVTFNFTTISVITDATTQKPFEVSFNNALWYRYVFN